MVGATQSQRKYEKTLENMHLKLKTNLTQYVYGPIHLPHLRIRKFPVIWKYLQIRNSPVIRKFGHGNLRIHKWGRWIRP